MAQIKLYEAIEQLGGSIRLFRKLAEGFIESYTYIDEDILDQYEISLSEARRLAHSMKGLSGNLGATDLMLKAKDLELSLKNVIERADNYLRPEFDILTKHDAFREELKLTVEQLQKILSYSDEEIGRCNDLEELFSQ